MSSIFKGDLWETYKQKLGNIESSNTYNIIGGSGDDYDGKYQFGRIAKKDIGLGHTPDERDSFRNDPKAQEKALTKFTKLNYKRLMKNPKFAKMDTDQQMGVLAYAHNQGAGGASNWLNTGIEGKDGFGTLGTKYYDAFTETPAFGNEELKMKLINYSKPSPLALTDSVPQIRPENLQQPNIPQLRPDNLSIQEQEVPQPQSFGQAFSQARKQHGGDGGVFEYNGNKYTTDIAKEVPAVAEPMFPREEFVPTVPPRVTSTADSRINVPPFKGLEIPELGFNNGTKAVPGYKDGSNFISDFFSKYFTPGVARNNQRVQEQEIINSVLDKDILNQENKEKAIMEAAQINAQRNAAAVPKLPDEKIIQTTLPPYVSNNDEIMQATLPRVNGPMNFKANTVNSLDNKANAPETQKQIDTKANMYAKSIADGSYGDPQAGYGEPVNKDISYHQSIYGPGVPQLGDEKALREREEYIQNLEIPVIKDKDPVESKDKTLSKDDNELKNNKASLVSETGLRLNASGNIIDSKGNKIEIPEPPNPDIKGKISSLLQTFFGLETADLGRAIGFYLASRATGASHAGSMRWAGTTVLKQAESRSVRNDTKTDAAIKAFAQVSNTYTKEASSKINKLLSEGKLLEAQTIMSDPDSKTFRGKYGIDADDAGTSMMTSGSTKPVLIFTGTNGQVFKKTTVNGKEGFIPISTQEYTGLRERAAGDNRSNLRDDLESAISNMNSTLFRQEGKNPKTGEDYEAGMFGGQDQAGVIRAIMNKSDELGELGMDNIPTDILDRFVNIAELAESQGIKKIAPSTLLDMIYVGGQGIINTEKLIADDGETMLDSSEIGRFTQSFKNLFPKDNNNYNYGAISTAFKSAEANADKDFKTIKGVTDVASALVPDTLTLSQVKTISSMPNAYTASIMFEAFKELNKNK